MSQALRTSSVVSSKIDPVDRLALVDQLADLLVVALAVGDRAGEDGRVGGDPDDGLLLDQVGQVAGLDPLAGQVVEPDRDAGVGEVLESLGHGGPSWWCSGWPSGWSGGCPRRRARRPRRVNPNSRKMVAASAEAPKCSSETLRPWSPIRSRQPRAMPGLDADPGLHDRRDHGVAVGLVLGVEPLAAGHRDDPGGDVLLGQQRAGLDGELHLRAGGDQDHVGRAAGGVEQDVAAPVDVGGGGPLLAVGVGAARERRHVLPGQRQAGRAVGVLEHGLPRGDGLVGVGRADDVEARDRPQRGDVLDRLVGRAVLADADGVVGPDVGHRELHDRRQPHRRPHVVGEHEERAAVDAGAAVQGDAVHDRAHGVLADAEVQHPAVAVALEVLGGELRGHERRLALGGRVVGAGQVGRAAPQLGQHRRDGGEHLAGGGAGGDALLVGLERRQRVVPAGGQGPRGHPVEERLALGVLRRPGVELLLPRGDVGAAALDQRAGVGEDLLGDLERLVGVEAQDLLGGRDLLVAEGGAVATCRCSGPWAPARR